MTYILHVEIEWQVECALQTCCDCVKTSKTQGPPTTPTSCASPSQLVMLNHPSFMMPSQCFLLPPASTSSAMASPSKPSLTPGSCASVLIQHCPACFRGTTFGRPLTHGGDIHVATDGNFHHCHRCSASDSLSFYNPGYFLPKHEVNSMGAHIVWQRKKPRKSCKLLVPDEAIDSCKASYEAADGKKQKASMDSFDDTGFMALICHHDIPLFFANIDSPGEQQKYVLVLLSHLFWLLPSQVMVVTLYDVSCVTERPLSLVSHLNILIVQYLCYQYEIFPEQITACLHFATTTMHAYGHEWVCQLVYNPRMVVGLGLSDGEGMERLWSCLTKLIGIECSSSVSLTWLLSCDTNLGGPTSDNDKFGWLTIRQQQSEQRWKWTLEIGSSGGFSAEWKSKADQPRTR